VRSMHLGVPPHILREDPDPASEIGKKRARSCGKTERRTPGPTHLPGPVQDLLNGLQQGSPVRRSVNGFSFARSLFSRAREWNLKGERTSTTSGS
jgi:hypothetical protein